MTGVLAPCWVTTQRAPTFSVMSMRPSGRKAIRQGRSRVVTWVMVKGRVGSGFCSPALICAFAWVAARARNIPAITNCFISFSLYWYWLDGRQQALYIFGIKFYHTAVSFLFACKLVLSALRARQHRKSRADCLWLDGGGGAAGVGDGLAAFESFAADVAEGLLGGFGGADVGIGMVATVVSSPTCLPSASRWVPAGGKGAFEVEGGEGAVDVAAGADALDDLLAEVAAFGEVEGAGFGRAVSCGRSLAVSELRMSMP